MAKEFYFIAGILALSIASFLLLCSFVSKILKKTSQIVDELQAISYKMSVISEHMHSWDTDMYIISQHCMRTNGEVKQ